jgi:hypothetical protein
LCQYGTHAFLWSVSFTLSCKASGRLRVRPIRNGTSPDVGEPDLSGYTVPTARPRIERGVQRHVREIGLHRDGRTTVDYRS